MVIVRDVVICKTERTNEHYIFSNHGNNNPREDICINYFKLIYCLQCADRDQYEHDIKSTGISYTNSKVLKHGFVVHSITM